MSTDAIASLAADLAEITDEEIERMSPDQLAEVARARAIVAAFEAGRAWRELARPEQIPPDEWSILALFGGRGSGKTWAAARTLLEMIRDDPLRETEGAGAWAVVAPTEAEGRDKCIEGPAGILAALGTNRAEVDSRQSATVKTWNRSSGNLELILHDGTRILVDGANDGAPSVQGENLRGAWASEVGNWRQWERAWDESLGFAVRLGQARIVVDGTPKRIMPARRLIRRLLDDPNVVTRRLRTFDNVANLSPVFLSRIAVWKGTQLGEQELEGKLLEDVEGALWKGEWFTQPGFRATEVPTGGWQRTVTGVDPSSGTDDGAAHAYTTVAKALDHYLYVVASKEVRGSTTDFVDDVLRHSQAIGSTVVVERNHGGEWLVQTFKRRMIDLGIRRPLKTVWASKGKTTRADPVAALYEPRDLGDRTEPGRVRHYGEHDALEDQMTGWSGAPGEPSPDLLDSAVWALSEFTGDHFKPLSPEQGRAVPYPDLGPGGHGPHGAVSYDGSHYPPGTYGHVFGVSPPGAAVPWER